MLSTFPTGINNKICIFAVSEAMPPYKILEYDDLDYLMMITGAGKHFRDIPKLWELNHSVTNHTESISSELYLMHVKRP